MRKWFYQIFNPTNERMDIEIVATNSSEAIPQAIETLRQDYPDAPDGYYYLRNPEANSTHGFKFERKPKDE